MMRIKTQNEIIEIINNTNNLTAIEIIHNSKNTQQASIIINDKHFSMPYEIKNYNPDFLKTLKNEVLTDELLISFTDSELPEAWKQAYLADNIPEERHDRRVKFHPYNEMNEQYYIDQTLLWDITDEFKGTPHEVTEENCKWRYEIIKWYKNHLI